MAHNGNYTHQTLRIEGGREIASTLKFAVLRLESARWFFSIIHILIGGKELESEMFSTVQI